MNNQISTTSSEVSQKEQNQINLYTKNKNLCEIFPSQRFVRFIQFSFIITSAKYLSLLQCRSATPSSIKLAYGDV